MPSTKPQHLHRAFELAAFLHGGDRSLAWSVTLDALEKLDVAAREQDKRRYYRAEHRRTKVSLSDPQLLQVLVCHASEPYELRREEQGDVTDADLLVRYLALLVRFCISRNSFHLTVGLHRLWYAYEAEEVRRVYDLLRQDPDQAKEESAFRACKKKIFDRLRERFGQRLITSRGARGAITPAPHPEPERFHLVIDHALTLLLPWETDCALPESFDPYDELSCFQSPGRHPDDGHRHEMSRIHTLLHLPCLRRMTHALNMDQPKQRLRPPHLKASEKNDDSSRKCDPLSKEEIDDLQGEIKRREKQRQRRATGLLSARLNGREAARWDPAQIEQVDFTFDDTSDCLEIWALGKSENEEQLLGIHLFGPDATEDPAEEILIRPARGRLLRLRFTPQASPFTRAKVCISYHERRPLQWLQTRHLSGPFQAASALRPALAVATLLVAVLWLAEPEGPVSIDPGLQQADPTFRSENEEGAKLGSICSVTVGDLGSDPWHETLSAHIEDLLRDASSIGYTEDLEEADAMLKRGRDHHDEQPLEALDRHLMHLRLAAPDGTILWASEFEGTAEEVAPAVVGALKAATSCDNNE